SKNIMNNIIYLTGPTSNLLTSVKSFMLMILILKLISSPPVIFSIIHFTFFPLTSYSAVPPSGRSKETERVERGMGVVTMTLFEDRSRGISQRIRTTTCIWFGGDRRVTDGNMRKGRR